MASPKTGGLVTVVVKVDGSELPGKFQLYSVDITKEINKIPWANIVFVDGSVQKQAFEINAEANLKPGKVVEVLAAFGTETPASIFKGIITKLAARLKNGRSFTYIECKDKAIKMTLDRHNAVFVKKKDDAIIKAVTGNAGVTGKVDATTYEHPFIYQFDATDWDFMRLRAEANGLIAIANDNLVDVKEPATAGEVVELNYGKDILELDIQVDGRSQISAAKASAWNIQNQSMTEIAGSASISETGDLTTDALAGDFSLGTHCLNHAGTLNDAELTAWGKAQLLRHKWSKITGKVQCHGFAGVKHGDTLKIGAISARYNGTLLVSGVSHNIINGNWTTTLQIGLTPLSFAESGIYNGQPAGGLLAPVYGLQVGKVTKIIEDPDSQERIELTLPAIDSAEKIWARKVYTYAGATRGICFRPEVGDEVIVGFLHSDARFPVILGSLYSSVAAPPLPAAEKNFEKGIFSKEGIKILFNDEKKVLIIQTPGGQIVTLDDENKLIELKDSNGNIIKTNDAGITIDSCKDVNINAKGKINLTTSAGDVTIKGVNVKNEASAKFEAKGNAGIDVNTSAILTLKGSMTKIN